MNCEDCGTRLESNGICPNCHEELFIARWQAEDLEYPLSEEFSRQVEEQAKAVRQAQRVIREKDEGVVR